MPINVNFVKLCLGYILAIFPIFLLIGPLVSELSLLILIIFSIYFILKEKKLNFLFNRFFVFFVLFYISTLFSTLINFYNLDYSKSAIFYIRLPLFAIGIWYILENFDIFNKKITLLYTVIFSILIFDSLYQYYSGQNIFGYTILKNRISSFFGEELILGGFITRIIPIFLIFLIMNGFINEKKTNLIYTVILSAASLIVYLTGERTSFFLLILFFFIIFFMCKHLRKFIIFTGILFVFFAYIVSNFKTTENINPGNRMFVKTYNQFMGHGEEKYEEYKKKLYNKVYVFSHDHHGHYLLSYRIFRDFPIFGTGAKGFRYLCRNQIYILEKNDGCSTHPHNTYVQVLVSNGLVGLSLLFFALFFIIREILICRKTLNVLSKFDKFEASKGIILSAILINIWPLIPSGNFFNNWLSMIYFYPVGFYLFFKNINEKKIN